MRRIPGCLAALGLIAACSEAPSAVAAPKPASAAPAKSAASGAAVSGAFVADGKAATLTEVSAHADEPFDGNPVTALVFTTRPQNGDANIVEDAHQGTFGDALIIRVQPDGSVIGADIVHGGLVKTNGYVSAVGLISLKDYSAAGGQIAGRLTSGGQQDSGAGDTINVDLVFHARAP